MIVKYIYYQDLLIRNSNKIKIQIDINQIYLDNNLIIKIVQLLKNNLMIYQLNISIFKTLL